MQLLELTKTVHFASTLFRDSIKYLYITLIHLYKYQLYVDILFMQHSRTKRRKCVKAKKSGHFDDGDADRRGQVTIIENRQRKPQSKTCSKVTAEWVGHLCRNLSGVQGFENRTQHKFCIWNSYIHCSHPQYIFSILEPSKQRAGFTPKQIIKYYQHD